MESQSTSNNNASRYRLHIVKSKSAKGQIAHHRSSYGIDTPGRGIFITCFMFVLLLSVYRLCTHNHVGQQLKEKYSYTKK
jgi:hypothetical protein